MFDLRFLNNLKQKLTTGNRGSIYLNGLSERYLSRLDMADLNYLRADLADAFLEVLTSEVEFQLALTPDGRERDQDEKLKLEQVLRRLSTMTIENNDHFSEHGVKTFGFGFPMLLYRDKKDPTRVIKAPMFVWSLDIERNLKRANEWIISRKNDFPVISNVVLAAYLRNDASIQMLKVYDQLLEDAILDKSEIAQLAYEQLQQLHPSLPYTLQEDFATELEQPIKAVRSRQYLDQLPLEQAQIMWSGVFGLFKSQKESIINDLDYFMEHNDRLQQEILASVEKRKSAPSLMQHSLTLVDTDPSQQHLLHLLEDGHNLVIQGPPGTGKSQTLTGIIANVLANQGTCLVVCEKKTALEVVQQNLQTAGLGELSVIIEDIYRDRSEVVDSVRERAQKQYPAYKTSASYKRVLEECLAYIKRLQEFHHSQLEAFVEDKTWAALVDDFLTSNERFDRQALAEHIDGNAFDYHPAELEAIFPIFEKGKQLLEPLGSLEHTLNPLHDRFFENESVTDSKLEIQRSLTDALRACNKTQDFISDHLKRYQEQLEQHYQALYGKKMALTDDLLLQCTELIALKHQALSKACKAAQNDLVHSHQQYKDCLEQHFDTIYANKILGIDKTATLIKAEIYGATDEALNTIKEAKEDIMACLYTYEGLLEEHYESIYMQQMDAIDKIEALIEAGLADSPYYFKKNKGLFRSMLRGISSKYKQLEADKLACIKLLHQLKKDHKYYDYFSFSFMETKDMTTFTFEQVLKNIQAYREANDTWHEGQQKRIQQHVRELSSRTSHGSIIYTKEAQAINQHLSDFRSKILRNKLITIDFKYDNLRLRDRFDQLETIERQVQKIKDKVDDFMRSNESDWEASSYEAIPNSEATYRTAYEELQAAHKAFRYFDYEFMKLGRPKELADYYVILKHLSDYRIKVEAWYPSRLPILEDYGTNFKANYLYPQLGFEQEVEALQARLKAFVEDYNQTQIFDLPFRLDALLFSEQLEELRVLETQLENWATSFDDVLRTVQEDWKKGPSKAESAVKVQISRPALSENLERLVALHQEHDYFDYTFDAHLQVQDLLQIGFIKSMAHYRTWTVEWFQNRSQVIENWIDTLSLEKVSPHLVISSEIESIHQQVEQFQSNFNTTACQQATFEYEALALNARKKQLIILENNLLKQQASFQNFDAYYHFRRFWLTLNPAQKAAYKGLAASGVQDWTNAFRSWYLNALLQFHQDKLPDQTNYYETQALYENAADEFRKLLVSHSLRYWRARQTACIETFHQEKAPIKLHSLYNKRGHTGGRRTSLRKIIHTDANLFSSFFPVLLVSPSVCSSILPLQADLFDVVIFDEASQLRLEDTFCALVRGRYKVVSGDSQQMPPSDYFQSTTVLINDDEYEEEASEEQEHTALVNESIDFLTTTESLLEYALAEGSYKESFLEVHYRSKHPYLIDFSNAAFYGNRLTPMPSLEDYTPIEFIAVNGLYVNYTNPSEAEQIIDYIISIAKSTRGKTCPSVGIATFNLHQRNLILEMIQKRSVEDSKASSALQKLFMNGLFVKNLENIQGDERDILIISTTFGLRENGSFVQNFGPINRRRGYRLLNVIITRAKQKLCVFTSIPSNYYESYRKQIQEKGNMGKAIFYAYLAYAKAVSAGDESSRAAILQLLFEHCIKKPVDKLLYQAQDNAFKMRVADYLAEQFPNRVEVNYRFAGFKIPIVIKDLTGKAKWAFDFDSFHEYESEEAYAWNLFREQHLKNFGFEYHRIWSKDWWKDPAAAATQLIALIV